jgi:Transglycosylase-like domain
LPDPAGRRRAASAAILSAVLLTALAPAVARSATPPPGLERFLYALGQVESHGNYRARNASSGAYGKYQIMPRSWAAWARAYLGSSSAPPTPRNQEVVTHRKVTVLHRWLDSWSVVAHWWLTGSSERNPARWSSFSRTYVARVIKLMRATGGSVGSTTSHSPTSWIDARDTRLAETSHAIRYSAGWKTARSSGYSGKQVLYATRTGASATLTFTGTGIAWIGPVGPTRGTARVYLDGKYVTTVSLRRAAFHARTILYARPFPTSGKHTLRIVVSSSGRPVAIDELIVGT